jgi:hypothetical protein
VGRVADLSSEALAKGEGQERSKHLPSPALRAPSPSRGEGKIVNLLGRCPEGTGRFEPFIFNLSLTLSKSWRGNLKGISYYGYTSSNCKIETKQN